MSHSTITKKILRIRRGEYLLAVTGEGIMTTFDTKKAMDITNWTLEQLGYIVSNLNRAGYKKAEVETVKVKQRNDMLEEAVRKIERATGETDFDNDYNQ
jgi:hypothetical protein